MGARFLSRAVAGVWQRRLIGRAQFPPAPELDQNRSPSYVPHLHGKEAERGPGTTFLGEFGGEKRGPTTITHEAFFWNVFLKKNENFTRNSLKISFFPRDFKGAKPLKITKCDSQGILFVIVLGQRICAPLALTPHKKKPWRSQSKFPMTFIWRKLWISWLWREEAAGMTFVATVFQCRQALKHASNMICELRTSMLSAPLANARVPKRGRSKRGRSQKHANLRKRAQKSAKEAQKSAEERKRV